MRVEFSYMDVLNVLATKYIYLNLQLEIFFKINPHCKIILVPLENSGVIQNKNKTLIKWHHSITSLTVVGFAGFGYFSTLIDILGLRRGQRISPTALRSPNLDLIVLFEYFAQ